MAYNRGPDRHQQAQHRAGPQAYAGHDRYDEEQYHNESVYQDRGGQRYDGYQQEVYDNNHQYSQNYDGAWQQEQNGSHSQPDMNGRPPAAVPQSRSYQYDDRYRQNSRQGPAYDGRDGAPTGRRSPQSRPGTSASSRRMKQDRILDVAAELDSPKAMGWDNPFGVFPGTKKDAELKKKAADEARSKSRAETPSDRPPIMPASSSRPPTSAGSREANNPQMTNQAWNEGQPHTAHSVRPDYKEEGGPPNGQYGRIDNMPLRKQRAPENDPQFDFGVPTPTANSRMQLPQQDLPTRPAPQRSATGPTPDRQPLSPTAMPAAYRGQPAPYGRREEHFPQHSQVPFDGGNNQYSNGSYGAANNSAYDEYETDPRGYSQPPPNNAMYSGQERREQPAIQAGPSPAADDPEFKAMPGAFEYRGVKLSRSTTDLNEPPMPNFAEMPANATENIEKQVTLQAQQPYSAYRKPVYGDNSSRPPPPTSTQRAPVRPGLTQDQNYSDYKLGPDAVSPGEYAAQTPRIDSAQGHNPGRDPRTGPRSPPAQYGIYDQQQFPPRKGSRPEQRGPAPASGFRHPYNQPVPGRPGPQHQKSPPRGAPYGNQAPPQSRRAPRQEYGFDNQGYPSGKNFMPDPYYEDPIHGTYPRDQAFPPEQPPHLVRSQTEPVYSPHEEQYNPSYSRRGPPGRTQPFDGGYEQQPPSPSRTRRQQPQYDQGHIYDQHGYSVPSRPRTANAANPPGRPYPDQGPPRSRPPNSGFPAADRNHPIPVRPGLMSPPPGPSPIARMPAAPPPTQVSPPRAQPSAAPQNRAPSGQGQRQPVTNAELNGLRDAFSKSPNNDRVGLQLAKKLVEAGQVLANNGGRADPKQTAKNRESYVNEAYKIVKRLVGGGSSEAMFYLADCYGSGQLGMEINPKEAFQLYTSAAKLNHAQAAYRVAVCCEMGMDGGGGTRRDHVKAVQFYKKAATLGDGPAMFKMGAILMKGLLGQQPNRREGIQWLKRAAERADEENPHALHELGSIYENAKSDDVVIKDERYAMELFTQAANLGYKHSQSRLGAAYEYGLMGCPIDPQKSIMWYSKAASQGEHLAEFALSGWYLTGAPPLLEASDQEAYLWARKAASSGLAKAEYAMGYYTETGIGTAPNVEEAKKWYFRAAGKFKLQLCGD